MIRLLRILRREIEPWMLWYGLGCGVAAGCIMWLLMTAVQR